MPNRRNLKRLNVVLSARSTIKLIIRKHLVDLEKHANASNVQCISEWLWLKPISFLQCIYPYIARCKAYIFAREITYNGWLIAMICGSFKQKLEMVSLTIHQLHKNNGNHQANQKTLKNYHQLILNKEKQGCFLLLANYREHVAHFCSLILVGVVC